MDHDKEAPWYPPVYALVDATAIKHLHDGTATPDEQRRALRWIIDMGCATYDLSYRPTSDRDTAFAEGRRFVGLQIVKLLKLNLSILKAEPTEQP